MDFDEMYSEIVARDTKIIELEQKVLELKRELDHANKILGVFTNKTKNRDVNACLSTTVTKNADLLDVSVGMSGLDLVYFVMTGPQGAEVCARSVNDQVAVYRDAETSKAAGVRDLAEIVRLLVLPIVKRKVLDIASGLDTVDRDKTSMAALEFFTNTHGFYQVFKKFLKTS